MHVTARWAAAAAFARGSLRVAARHGDLIALRLDLGALRRGLRGAAALGPEGVELRLTTVERAGGGARAPALRLAAAGGDAGLTTDLPLLAPPLAPADVDALVAERDAAPLAAFYVDAAPAAARLAAAADRLALLCNSITVDLDPAGCITMRAAGSGAALAGEVGGLDVLPPAARAPPRAAPADLASTAPPPHGVIRVTVASKHVVHALGAAASMRAARALVGVPPGGAALHFILAFADPAACGIDPDTDLAMRVPVLADEEL
jgi:hypothetical protein